MIKKSLLAASLIAIVGGCGGSNTSSTTTYSGKVIDDYIKDATVCYDLNGNSNCDSDEPTAQTDENGNFSFEYDGELDDNVSLISYGGIDTGTGVAFSGLLKAPHDFTNITPASTLIKSAMEDGLDVQTASQKVATLLGVSSEDLKKDPVAEFENNATLLKLNVKLQKLVEIAGGDKAGITSTYKNLAHSLQTTTNFDSLIDKTISDTTLQQTLKNFNKNVDAMPLTKDSKVAFTNSLHSLTKKIKIAKTEGKTLDMHKLFSACTIDATLDDSNVTDTPPNNGENIPYFSVGTKVSDIEAAFNFARAKDTTLTNELKLPSQDIWDKLSQEEQALYILNKERIDRGLKPYEGVESMNTTLSQTTLTQASTLSDISQAYTNLLYTKTTLSHELDGTVSQRIAKVTQLSNDTLGYIHFNESLYAEGNSYKLDTIPLIHAIYNWIYADKDVASGEPWGHRAMCLQKVTQDDFGVQGAEGIITFGLVQGEESKLYPNFKTSIVTMNAFNPKPSYKGKYKKAQICFGENTQTQRFTRVNGTIIDTNTTLVWQDINQTSATLTDAQTYCSNLDFAGETDWRLPSTSEISTFYKEALASGITPNLTHINSSKMAAIGGFVYTSEGVTSTRKLGEITTAYAESSKGDVKCVRGTDATPTSTNSNDSITLDSQKSIALDTAQNLMFENQTKISGRYGQNYAKIACNNLDLGDYTNWRLPTSTELSNFHKKAKDENITLSYYKSYCTYEATNERVDDKYYKVVRVQKDDTAQNLIIGNIYNFSSSSGVRCVRDVEINTSIDTTPPQRVDVNYTADNLIELSLSDTESISQRTYIKIHGDCTTEDDNKTIHCPNFAFTLHGEVGSELYTVDSHGKLDAKLGTFDGNGEIFMNMLDENRTYRRGINTTATHSFDSLGDYVAVDNANNISKINKVFVHYVPENE